VPVQLLIETGLGWPGQDWAPQPQRRAKWRPGKGMDVATSPDGHWLAASFLDAVRLFSAALLTGCEPISDTMKEAEVCS
jgi:hypothetical protein